MRIGAPTAALAIALLAGAAQAFTPAARTIKDWTAVCDNVGTCAGFGFAPDDSETPIFLRITREAGPAAAPGALIVYDPADAHKDQRWTLSVDDKPVVGAGVVTARGGDSGARATLDAAQTAALIEALRNGRRLGVLRDGKPIGTVSLAGSFATLLWVDADQGRAGTVTAMIDRGGRPASSVPPPAPAPVIDPAPPISQAHLPKLAPPGLIASNGDCDIQVTLKQLGTSPDDIVARLSPGVVLWAPECSLAAYNETNLLFLGDESGAHTRPLRLPTADGGARDDNELVDAAFDPKTQTLTTFAKGRGVGDCGDSAQWVWDGQAFRLLSEFSMSECEGVPPDDWPALYVARLK